MINHLCWSRREVYVLFGPDAGSAAQAAAKGATTGGTVNLWRLWNDELHDVHPVDRQVGNIY